MKVKVIDYTQNYQKYYDLTVGNTYRVLGIEADDIRIMSDIGRPWLYPRSLFEVVDDTLPSDWVTEYGEEGEFYASPSALNSRGFWEGYFEHENDKKITLAVYLQSWLRGEY